MESRKILMFCLLRDKLKLLQTTITMLTWYLKNQWCKVIVIFLWSVEDSSIENALNEEKNQTRDCSTLTILSHVALLVFTRTLGERCYHNIANAGCLCSQLFALNRFQKMRFVHFSSIREFMDFTGKIIVERTEDGQRTSIGEQSWFFGFFLFCWRDQCKCNQFISSAVNSLLSYVISLCLM